MVEALPFIYPYFYRDNLTIALTSGEKAVLDIIDGFHSFSLESVEETAIN